MALNRVSSCISSFDDLFRFILSVSRKVFFLFLFCFQLFRPTKFSQYRLVRLFVFIEIENVKKSFQLENRSKNRKIRVFVLNRVTAPAPQT